MMMKTTVTAVFAALAVNLLLSSGVLFAVRVYLVERLLSASKGIVISHYFPEGILSIGALIYLKSYIADQLRSCLSFVRRWTG